VNGYFIGSKGAILSTMRHTPVQAFVDRYRALGQLDKEILIVWGRDDQAFPFPTTRRRCERSLGLVSFRATAQGTCRC
jgi:hypothetical protein